jgi:hypothetical protein
MSTYEPDSISATHLTVRYAEIVASPGQHSLQKGVPRSALVPGDSINSALFGPSPRVCVVLRIVSFMVTIDGHVPQRMTGQDGQSIRWWRTAPERSDVSCGLDIRLFGMGQVGKVFANRVLGSELDAMRVVNDPIQHGVGDPPAAEVFMPVGHRCMGSYNRGAHAVALFDGFEEILLL